MDRRSSPAITVAALTLERDRLMRLVSAHASTMPRRSRHDEQTTIELDSETLARARAAGIDLSDVLTRALHRELPKVSDADRKRAAEQWYAENKEAIDALNKLVEKHGLFSNGARMF